MEEIKERPLTFEELKALTQEIDAFLAEVEEKQKENERLKEEELQLEMDNISFVKKLRKSFERKNKN